MKRVFVLLLIILFMTGVSGCMVTDELKESVQGIQELVSAGEKNATDTALEKLSMKYGTDFTVLKVGDRIDTESTTFYLCPKDREEPVFQAIVDGTTGEVTDNYVSRQVALEYNGMFEDLLRSKNITGTVSASFICDDDSKADDIETSVEDYFEVYHVKSAFLRVALDGSTLGKSAAADLIAVCRQAQTETGAQVAVSGAVIGERYGDCAKDMKREPRVSATWFDAYSPAGTFRFAVTDGESNISAETLQEQLAGE